MNIDAMNQALDALEQHGTPVLNHEDAYLASLTALRQAIEAAEKQEPDELTIAYMSGFYDGKNKYAPRREWVGLTDENIQRAIEVKEIFSLSDDEFAKTIEAKCREKNGC